MSETMLSLFQNSENHHFCNFLYIGPSERKGKMKNRVFTSESVTEGHPDKLCDQISDAVLDNILGQDKNARVACECVTTTGMVLVTGEITASCYVDIPSIVRQTVQNIGYDNPEYGFDYKACACLPRSTSKVRILLWVLTIHMKPRN